MQSSEAKRDGEAMNAYEYAVDELGAADEPLSPAKLADGYGCSGGHMRSVLCDLVRDGEAERIAHGRYIEGPGPESREPDIQSNGSAQDAANVAGTGDIQADATGESSDAFDSDADGVTDSGSGSVAAAGAATAGAALPALLDPEINPATLALLGVALALVVGFLLFADPSGEPDDDAEPEGEPEASGADFAGAFEG